ncbi:CinA family nicotinamide mononucleotide deamidase-related protein [Candidatus Mcinerneyibacteriota bacterium]|nr:CinA family nicotinamide mononucleotide deamidase-related protein [Candidatus Mcinerneyibacteriota bacterium]
MKRCAFLSVGDEILRGFTTDTNAGWFARALSQFGWEFTEGQTVRDDVSSIHKALTRLKNADLILITGGLGPTEDDVTREGAAAYLGKKLFFREELWQEIRKRFKKRGGEIPLSNKKQAFLIEGALPLKNKNGTAPGQFYDNGTQVIILLPGPPSENRPMFLTEVMPLLRDRGEEPRLKSVIGVVGGGESYVAQIAEPSRLQGIEAGYYYNSEGWVEIHLYNRDLTKDEFFACRQSLVCRLHRDPSLFLFSGSSLNETLFRELRKREMTIAFAESLTGGLAGDRLVSLPGASSIFLGSVVAYDNAMKETFLGVRLETLKAHGAVSKETAQEMAEGIARVSGSDTALSFTGIAGPSGGTREKPVGLICIGIAVMGDVSVECLQLHGSRERIRRQAVSYGYAALLRRIGYSYR